MAEPLETPHADGVLHVVATPLGNLGDLSPRAAEVLRRVARVFAEDTRRTRILLQHIGANPRLQSAHEHNERQRVSELLSVLAAGEDAALVSDAGTPGVSDPGAELVAAALAAGHRVVAVAGPSALAAAVSIAGFPQAETDVWFVGFVPVKGKERRARLDAVAAHPGLVVLYEGPHRLADTLQALAERQPERPARVMRELTKMHEEIWCGSLAELAARAQGEVLGELVVVLGPQAAVPPIAAEDAAVLAALRRCEATGLSRRDAVSAVAAVLERPRREVYALATKEEE